MWPAVAAALAIALCEAGCIGTVLSDLPVLLLLRLIDALIPAAIL